MSHDNFLPSLQDRRLSLVQQQSSRTRKITNMFNSKLRVKHNRFDKTMERDKKAYDYKMWQRSLPIKHSLTHIKGTQKCLRRYREHTFIEDSEDRHYGIYDGLSLRDLQPEVNAIIEEAQPSTRRRKKVGRLLNDGKRDGRIIDMDTARKSFHAILNRPKYPPKKEAMLGFDSPSPSPSPEIPGIRPNSVFSTPETIFRKDTGDLPTMQTERINTKTNLFKRLRSDTLPTILPTNRSNTFSFEPKLSLRRLSQIRRF